MQTQCRLVLQHKRRCEDGRELWRFCFVLPDDGLKHIDKILKSNYTSKDMETPRFEDSDLKKAFVFAPRA